MSNSQAELEKRGWKIIRSLGEGGQGKVELVQRTDGADGKNYALKRLSSRGGATAVKRFRQEMETLSKLNHPHIIKPVDWSKQDDSLQFYVMEYFDGAKPLQKN
jgi:serine/threonine protein kinase